MLGARDLWRLALFSQKNHVYKNIKAQISKNSKDAKNRAEPHFAKNFNDISASRQKSKNIKTLNLKKYSNFSQKSL